MPLPPGHSVSGSRIFFAAGGSGGGALNYGAPYFIAPPPSNGQEGIAYSFQLNTAGAIPQTFALVSGSLPTGYTLDETTGIISGTCLTGSPDPFNFELSVTNEFGSSTSAFQMYVEGTLPVIDYDPAFQYFSQHIGSGDFQLGGNPASVTSDIGGLYISGTPPITYADITTDPNEPLPEGVALDTNTARVSGTVSDQSQLFDVFRFGIYGENFVGIGNQLNYSLFPLANVYWGEWIGALPGTFTAADITATLTDNGTPGPRVYPNDTKTIVGFLSFCGSTSPIWGGDLLYPGNFQFPVTGVARSRVLAVPQKFFTGTANFYWSLVEIGTASLTSPAANQFTPNWPTPYQTGLVITENGVDVVYDIYVLTARTTAATVQWAVTF